MTPITRAISISLQVLAYIGLVFTGEVLSGGHAATETSSKLATEARDEHATVVTSSGGAPKNEVLVQFTSADLAKLSRAQHDFKDISLDDRCAGFERTLREVFEDKQVEDPGNTRRLFERAIELLAARTNPYHSEQPYVKPLRECIEKLTDHELDLLATGASPRRKVVVRGPDSGAQQAKKEPMKEVLDEFAGVKTRVINPVADLYPPRAAGSVASDELHRQESAAEFHGELYNEHGDEHPERPLHRAMDAGFMKEIVGEAVAEEELDRKIEEERDAVMKLQLQLEREKRRTKSLLEQLDENRYEIEELLEEKAQREAKDEARNLDDSRFEMMKSMYEKASEREQQTRSELAEVKRQLVEVMNERSSEDEDDSDSDSDHEDGDGKRELAKMAKKLQSKMSPREPTGTRCQKYYMLQNYPKKVTEKVVKVLASLSLPPADPRTELYPALARFASDLSVGKSTEKVLRELNECQAVGKSASSYQSAPNSAAAPTEPEVAAVATATATSSRPAEFIGGRYQVHYESDPDGYYHREVLTPSPESSVHVVKTSSKSKSYGTGFPASSRFNVPVVSGRVLGPGNYYRNW